MLVAHLCAVLSGYFAGVVWLSLVISIFGWGKGNPIDLMAIILPRSMLILPVLFVGFLPLTVLASLGLRRLGATTVASCAIVGSVFPVLLVSGLSLWRYAETAHSFVSITQYAYQTAVIALLVAPAGTVGGWVYGRVALAPGSGLEARSRSGSVSQ